jgi:head-tail adaptor
MRNIVKVYEPTVSTDATGQETYGYSLYKKVYASYERDAFSKDEAGFIQASGHETISFKFRYDAAISYNHRVEFEGVMYRIVGLDNFMNLRHELRVTCTAVNL